MPVPQQVTQWVEEKYRRPRIDPEWLNDCYAWLTTVDGQNPNTNLQSLLNAVEYQILESSFTESMLPGTGLPIHSAAPKTIMTLEGLEILVEIVSIMEITSSAFSLNQTRLAREERTKAGDVDDGEGEGDIEIEGEGPMPKYSRGMLKFQLTDGATMLPAIEYRPLPELSLENTPLGYKMLLRNVTIRRGVAFLEPKCVTLLGHTTAERDEKRHADFARGLRFRMGLPEPEPEPEQGNTIPATVPTPAVNNQTRPTVPEVRSPLRDISPPPLPAVTPAVNDDEDLEPRRRRIPTRNTDAIASQAQSTARSDATGFSPYFSTALAGKSGPQSTVQRPDKQLGTTKLDISSLKRREVSKPAFITPPPPSPGPDDEDFWASDQGPMNGCNVRNVAELSTNKQYEQGKANGKGKAVNQGTEDVDDFEDDGMDFDPKFLEGLDAVEKEAYNRIMGPPHSSKLRSTSGSSDKSCSSTAAPASTGRSVAQAIEVITIDDDDEGDAEDKENVPVPTRHVRRRTEDDGRGALGARALSGSQKSRDPGRPTILAKTASAVIDLSDSD